MAWATQFTLFVQPSIWLHAKVRLFVQKVGGVLDMRDSADDKKAWQDMGFCPLFGNSCVRV